MLRTRFLRSLLATALAAAGVPALAGSATGTVATSATLTADCTISISPLSFSTSSALIATNADTTTSLQVACTQGTAYSVALSAGAYPGATTTTRRMMGSDGTSSVSYSISQDVARSKNWGTVVGTDTLAGVGAGTTVNVSVYSRIPAGQPAVPAMTYTDTVTATVSY